MNPFINPLNHK